MGRITASRKQLKPDPRVRVAAGQQVRQLPDARRQEERALRTCSTTRWTSIKKRVPDNEPIEVFTQAVENVKPSIEVRSKRVGGAAYQVPMQVNRTRQQSLAIRWILMAVREKKGRATHAKLADELLAAYNREGAADDPPRKRPPHGRRQQGVRPLRVVGLHESHQHAACGVAIAATAFLSDLPRVGPP